MPNPSEWMQLYQNNFPNINPTEIPPSTTTTTTAAAANSRNDHDLSPSQGRVSKPVRKRSRASRRTPTTLLNTDTANFRAMVQQFTGGPATASAARPQLPVALGTFGFTQHVASTTAAVAPAGGFQVQYPNQMQQQHMFMLSSNVHGGGVSSHAPPGPSPTNENRNYDNYML